MSCVVSNADLYQDIVGLLKASIVTNDVVTLTLRKRVVVDELTGLKEVLPWYEIKLTKEAR